MNYLVSFFQVVIVNCLSPSNLDVCLSYNHWFPQYVDDYCRFRLHEPYSIEKSWLQKHS